MKKLLFWALLIIPFSPLPAHGAEYAVLSDRVIRIEARFDSGAPFSHSDVMVFPPGESESAYTLRTDGEGIFHFAPDRQGTWILQVRGEGGHGLRINFPVDDQLISRHEGYGGTSMMQKLLMTFCVLWGAAGTALYFRRRG